MGFSWPIRRIPKVGPMGAHLRAPKGLQIQGWGERGLNTRTLALVVLVDLAIRSAKLLPVHVDFVEVLCLLHKDGPFMRWFTQLYCRLPSALH